MTPEVDRSRFAHLPEPVRPEDWVETTDVRELPHAEVDADAEFVKLAAWGGGIPV